MSSDQYSRASKIGKTMFQWMVWRRWKANKLRTSDIKQRSFRNKITHFAAKCQSSDVFGRFPQFLEADCDMYHINWCKILSINSYLTQLTGPERKQWAFCMARTRRLLATMNVPFFLQQTPGKEEAEVICWLLTTIVLFAGSSMELQSIRMRRSN